MRKNRPTVEHLSSSSMFCSWSLFLLFTVHKPNESNLWLLDSSSSSSSTWTNCSASFFFFLLWFFLLDDSVDAFLLLSSSSRSLLLFFVVHTVAMRPFCPHLYHSLSFIQSSIFVDVVGMYSGLLWERDSFWFWNAWAWLPVLVFADHSVSGS